MRALTSLRRSLTLFGLAAVVGLLPTAAIGCYPSGEGEDPKDDRPYFPTGIALSPSGRWLFVASSNFDLAYNAGTVQAYDVASIAAAAEACRTGASRDCEVDAPRFVRAGVRIGAFAADMRAIARRAPDGSAVANGGRLLLPVRGNASLTAIDWDESGDTITLRCTTGARPGSFGTRCANEWLLGTDPAKSSRQLSLGGEPFGVAVPEAWPADANIEPRRSGGIAAVVHQQTGNVSLFVDVAVDGPTPQGKLAHVLSGLAAGGTGIAALDNVIEGPLQTPRFIVTNRTQSNVFILQYFPDPQKERGGLVLSEVVPIPPQSAGFDTRGVTVDPPNEGETRPTRVFLTNRTPAALVIGQVDPVTRKLDFYENVALPIGPSRITRAVIDGRTLILAASFDARSIAIYDPDARRLTNVVRTHRGPYGMVVDPVRKLGFVSNFTDSTIQVIDLDPAHAGTASYERVIFSVGVPSGPSR